MVKPIGSTSEAGAKPNNFASSDSFVSTVILLLWLFTCSLYFGSWFLESERFQTSPKIDTSR